MRVGILTGPTATGKTALAVRLAARTGNVEIVNADSMLVYRGMDIGTAKPDAKEKGGIHHHLIDLRSPDDAYTAGDFVRDALAAIEEIESRGKRALIVGGTGFYLKALLYGMWDQAQSDPEVRARIEQEPSPELYRRLFERDEPSALRIGGNDRYRLVRAIELLETTGKTPTELQAAHKTEPDPRFSLWVIDRAPDELHRRISLRAEQMLKVGLVAETEAIRAKHPSARALSAVGYRQVCDSLDGKAPEGRKVRPGAQGLRDEIELGTRQLVKQQRTWFKGEKSTQWFMLDADLPQLELEFNRVYGDSL